MHVCLVRCEVFFLFYKLGVALATAGCRGGAPNALPQSGEMHLQWYYGAGGKEVCREFYEFPLVTTPADTIDSIPCSLYEAEKNDMNNFESRVIDYVVGLKSIQWRHRIIERKVFRINGFINHYPDFVVKTKSGKIVMIETKGDDRDNSDSKAKT